MPSDTSTTQAQSSGDHAPSRLGDAAGDVLDQAGRTAERQASTAMTKAGDTLDQLARAVRDSGNQLRNERPEIANVADTAAQRVEGLASYLRQHDAREILDQAEQMARQQPALVVGGGLVLGLVAGRLLRSGAEPNTNGTNGSSQHWSGGAGGAGSTSGSSYAGASGWSGGSSSDLSSSRPAGTTTPASGYGTGYGAGYDTTVDAVPDTAADELAATDAAAGNLSSRSSTSRSSGTRSSSKRRSSATGES